ncbi:MAG: EVE domain-containing protein [Methanomassiliicoccales archaeon]
MPAEINFNVQFITPNVRRWLVKEEPSHYSFEQLQMDGETLWDGVKNNQALKYMREMKQGDEVLYYHTGDEKLVVGTAVVSKVQQTEKQPLIYIRGVKTLRPPVTLAEIKESGRFANHPLVRQPRLSVMPVDDELWDFITSGR